PCPRQRRLELIEAAAGDIGQQLVAIAKVPIGRRRADPRPARGFREGEAGGPFLGDQFEGGADQRLFQVAMMVAARSLPPPTPVKGLYMTPGTPSTSPGRQAKPFPAA